jgi:hypothetical protein
VRNENVVLPVAVFSERRPNPSTIL